MQEEGVREAKPEEVLEEELRRLRERLERCAAESQQHQELLQTLQKEQEELREAMEQHRSEVSGPSSAHVTQQRWPGLCQGLSPCVWCLFPEPPHSERFGKQPAAAAGAEGVDGPGASEFTGSDRLRVEGTSGEHLVRCPCSSRVTESQLLRTMSRCGPRRSLGLPTGPAALGRRGCEGKDSARKEPGGDHACLACAGGTQAWAGGGCWEELFQRKERSRRAVQELFKWRQCAGLAEAIEELTEAKKLLEDKIQDQLEREEYLQQQPACPEPRDYPSREKAAAKRDEAEGSLLEEMVAVQLEEQLAARRHSVASWLRRFLLFLACLQIIILVVVLMERDVLHSVLPPKMAVAFGSHPAWRLPGLETTSGAHVPDSNPPVGAF
ncbi:uncharacterized protein LJ264_006890 [Porphyrio hochstetteri]